MIRNFFLCYFRPTVRPSDSDFFVNFWTYFFFLISFDFFYFFMFQMEDEGNHGNDDTRCFILSTLAAMHMSRVSCVLCDSPMLVFDRYPLVDGTFFLSPRQHSKSCLEVRIENRTQYLSAVCMTCLEGWGAGRRLRCLYCATPWDGSSLVIGTMYSYDIFAAMPCCTERLRVSRVFHFFLKVYVQQHNRK